MAPLPIIPDVIRVAFNWTSATVAGFTATNVMHFLTPNDSVGLGEDIISTVATAGEGMFATVCGGYTVTSMQLTPLDGVTATLDVDTSAFTGFGGAGGSDFTPQGAALIKFTTATRGRSARGRMYLPFLAEDCQSFGSLTSGKQTELQDGWESFLDDMATHNALGVVASYVQEEAYPITAHLAETSIATQRRRNKRPY